MLLILLALLDNGLLLMLLDNSLLLMLLDNGLLLTLLDNGLLLMLLGCCNAGVLHEAVGYWFVCYNAY